MKVSIAIVISVAVHVLVGLVIWAYMEYAPSPDVFATLDLSSVELSFAEDEDDTAAVLPQPPNPVAPQPEPERPPKPKVVETPEPLPSIPSAVEIPKPVEKPVLPASSTQHPAPSVPQPRQARIDAPPRPKRAIKPDYPKGSRQRGEQGDVVVEMTVNSQGEVDKASVVISSGFAELDEAALRAVRSAKFTPAKSGRESVASTARLALAFKLR